VAAKLGLGMGKIAQPLRVAMTGTQVSPSIDHTIYLAGREEALKRIDAALAMAKG
jgi:glutamyl-tRNA synthetase